MKNLLIVVGLVVLAGAIFWLAGVGNSTEYVTEVTSEVAELEAELIALEAAVAAGTLTPTQAAVAQARIVARLDAIDASVAGNQKATLTPAQQTQLMAGLDKLKSILTEYRATLVAVDEAVLTLPEAERPTLRRGGGGGNRSGVVAAAAETVAVVEDHVEDVVEEYEPTTESETELSGTTTPEMEDEEMSDSDDDMTDVEMSDEDTMMDEADEADSNDEESMDDDTAADVSIEVENNFEFDSAADEETDPETVNN